MQSSITAAQPYDTTLTDPARERVLNWIGDLIHNALVESDIADPAQMSTDILEEIERNVIALTDEGFVFIRDAELMDGGPFPNREPRFMAEGE